MHKSVLLQETVDFLAPKKGGAYIDATVGAGGHASEILKRIGETGRLLVIDQDQMALEIAKKKLKAKNVQFAHANFDEIASVARERGFTQVDGIMADLGVSSMQFDMAERGFSFRERARLDMRMDKTSDLTAETVVNTYPTEELVRIFREYGEEREAKRIAKEIAIRREQSPIIWTDQLAEVVRGVKKDRKIKIDPATQVFQALRIEVNKELSALESALPQMVSLLKPSGRLAIISFHSLEDRIVKRFIEESVKTCVCPPDFPKCVCDTEPTLKKVTKKAIVAAEPEIVDNPRSRSAKLRVAEKL